MEKKGISIISVAVLLIVLLSSVGVSAEFDHEIRIEKMGFRWKVDGENLVVELSARTKGWVAIGFNPSDEMKDANIVIAYVKRGEARIRDDFGVSENSHVQDTRKGGRDNVTVISGKEENGMTTVAFSIPLDSGDSRDQPIVTDGETVVLLAYNRSRDSFRPRHSFRTRLKVNLNTGKYRVD